MNTNTSGKHEASRASETLTSQQGGHAGSVPFYFSRTHKMDLKRVTPLRAAQVDVKILS